MVSEREEKKVPKRPVKSPLKRITYKFDIDIELFYNSSKYY